MYQHLSTTMQVYTLSNLSYDPTKDRLSDRAKLERFIIDRIKSLEAEVSQIKAERDALITVVTSCNNA